MNTYIFKRNIYRNRHNPHNKIYAHHKPHLSKTIRITALSLICSIGLVSHVANADETTLLASNDFYQSYGAAPNIATDHIDTLYRAEQNASDAGKQVLQTVRQMALEDQEIISGGCWDYLDAAFDRANVERQTVYSESYPNGPFVQTDRIQAGDWLYYVNHSYNDVQHSGLFVGWVDRDANQALILSYAGESRHEPARYRLYDVSDTYNIIRPTFD